MLDGFRRSAVMSTSLLSSIYCSDFVIVFYSPLFFIYLLFPAESIRLELESEAAANSDLSADESCDLLAEATPTNTDASYQG